MSLLVIGGIGLALLFVICRYFADKLDRLEQFRDQYEERP